MHHISSAFLVGLAKEQHLDNYGGADGSLVGLAHLQGAWWNGAHDETLRGMAGRSMRVSLYEPSTGSTTVYFRELSPNGMSRSRSKG